MRGIRELSSPTWQPIETAPKDGTVIDLWAVREATGEADRYANCIWARTVWGGEPIGEPRWQGLYDRYSVVTPTHWMPLPLPPESSGRNLADATSNPHPTGDKEGRS